MLSLLAAVLHRMIHSHLGQRYPGRPPASMAVNNHTWNTNRTRQSGAQRRAYHLTSALKLVAVYQAVRPLPFTKMSGTLSVWIVVARPELADAAMRCEPRLMHQDTRIHQLTHIMSHLMRGVVEDGRLLMTTASAQRVTLWAPGPTKWREHHQGRSRCGSINSTEKTVREWVMCFVCYVQMCSNRASMF